jgi:hypothetical protein
VLLISCSFSIAQCSAHTYFGFTYVACAAGINRELAESFRDGNRQGCRAVPPVTAILSSTDCENPGQPSLHFQYLSAAAHTRRRDCKWGQPFVSNYSGLPRRGADSNIAIHAVLDISNRIMILYIMMINPWSTIIFGQTLVLLASAPDAEPEGSSTGIRTCTK